MISGDNYLVLLSSLGDSRVVIRLSCDICLQSAADRVRSFPDLSGYFLYISQHIYLTCPEQLGWLNSGLHILSFSSRLARLGHWAVLRVLREWIKILQGFLKPGLERAPSLLWHFTGHRHRGSPDSEWGIDMWEELQSHIAKGNDGGIRWRERERERELLSWTWTNSVITDCRVGGRWKRV